MGVRYPGTSATPGQVTNPEPNGASDQKRAEKVLSRGVLDHFQEVATLPISAFRGSARPFSSLTRNTNCLVRNLADLFRCSAHEFCGCATRCILRFAHVHPHAGLAVNLEHPVQRIVPLPNTLRSPGKLQEERADKKQLIVATNVSLADNKMFRPGTVSFAVLIERLA